MGAFNTLKSEWVCPSCGERAGFNTQFKYGAVWQFEYHLGDQLQWGVNDQGKPGCKRVVLDGVMEECPLCGAEGEDCEIWMENDCFVAVQPVSGKYDFVAIQDSYIVIVEE